MSINYPLQVSKKAIYYILRVLPRYMIGLKADEWDMILGGLEAFLANEEDWLNDDREDVKEDAKKTIEKLDLLYKKVNLIRRGMRYFEGLMAE